MKDFYIYGFRDRIDGPFSRAIVARRDVIDPGSYSAGSVARFPTRERDIRGAYKTAREIAPRVFDYSGREIR